MRRATSVATAIGALTVLAAWALPAAAQTRVTQGQAPEYVSSEPSEGETVHQAPDEVVVRFSEPLDPSSTLAVTDQCGRTVDDGEVTVTINEMRVGLRRGPQGHYMVSYTARGLGGLTGESEGTFHFMVHMGPSCDGTDHRGHPRGDGKGREHGGHDRPGHEDPDHRRPGHQGLGSSGTGHPSMDGMGEGSGTHPKDGHERGRRHPGKQRGRGDDPIGDRPAPMAAPPGAPPAADPTAGAVLAGLALSMALGVFGGWYLRVTAGR